MNARDGLPIAVLGGEFVGMSRNIGDPASQRYLRVPAFLCHHLCHDHGLSYPSHAHVSVAPPSGSTQEPQVVREQEWMQVPVVESRNLP